jgi:hypothetical protein
MDIKGWDGELSYGRHGWYYWLVGGLSDGSTANTAPPNPGVFLAVPDMVPYTLWVTTVTIRMQEDEENGCIRRPPVDSPVLALSRTSEVVDVDGLGLDRFE